MTDMQTTPKGGATDSATADSSSNGKREGLFIRGTLKGTQPARSFERSSDQTTVHVKPRIGLDVNGVEFVVKCKDDEQMAAALRGHNKGDVITLSIEARPPFGARGEVDFTLPGVIERQAQSWS